MRFRFLVCAGTVALTPACGDGLGQPIVVHDAASSAGKGGAAAGPGAGSGGGSGGRVGGPPMAGMGPGRGGAGQGGMNPPDGDCGGIPDWSNGSREAEDEFLEALNYAREIGSACSSGPMGPSGPPLSASSQLRCAARLHSRDMLERRFFDHVNPDGVGPEDRMRRAGASFRVAGESIARSETMGAETFPWRAFEELFASGGSECQNLTDSRFDAVGIGYFEGYWTLDFTGP